MTVKWNFNVYSFFVCWAWMCGPHWHEYLVYLPPEQLNDFIVLKQSHCTEPTYVKIWDVLERVRLISNGRTSNTAQCMKYQTECMRIFCPILQTISVCKSYLPLTLVKSCAQSLFTAEVITPHKIHYWNVNVVQAYITF